MWQGEGEGGVGCEVHASDEWAGEKEEAARLKI